MNEQVKRFLENRKSFQLFADVKYKFELHKLFLSHIEHILLSNDHSSE